MHNPFLVTCCLGHLLIIKMPCVMIAEQNIRLYYRMFRLPTCGRSESFNFYSMHRGRLLFLSQVFSRERQTIQGFLLVMNYGLIQKLVITHRCRKDNLEGTRNRKMPSFGDTTWPCKESRAIKMGLQ